MLIAWLLIALMLLVDLSMSDLAAWVTAKLQALKTKVDEDVHSKRVERAQQKAEAQLPLEETNTPAMPEARPQVLRPVSAQVQPTEEERATEPEWKLPVPSEVLDPVKAAPIDEESDEDRARVIEETLRSFNAPAKVVEIRRGPSITMFGVEPEYLESRNGKTKVRVSNIVRLADDLSMALKASRIRMQAPVPGKGYVGVEVPNIKTAMVSMLDVVGEPSIHRSPLPTQVRSRKGRYRQTLHSRSGFHATFAHWRHNGFRQIGLCQSFNSDRFFAQYDPRPVAAAAGRPKTSRAFDL